MLYLLSILTVLGGGLPTKRLVKRLWGVDLATVGSGNAGAGNATRSVGFKAGALVAVIDGLKGLVPVLVGRHLGASDWFLATIGVLAVAGNNWPMFGRRRGGRGLATSAGVMLGVAPALLAWPALWAIVGWRIGGGIAGFLGWGLLPLVAATTGQSPPQVALTLGLATAMVVRRAQGNDGAQRGLYTSRMLFDRDDHASAGPGLSPSVITWIACLLLLYGVGGWWGFHGDSTAAIGYEGMALLVVAVGFEFGAKWAFAELFREGLSGDVGARISRQAAFRAALIGSGVARLIPAGGAVTPVAMAWAVNDEAPRTSGSAIRATMLNYAGLLIATGLAVLWVLASFDDKRYAGAVLSLGVAMLAMGAGLALGAGRLGRASRMVPRRWRDRAQSALTDRALTRRSVLLIVARVLSEAMVLAVTLLAFAIHLAPSQVIAAFGVSQLIGGLPGPPGGVGVTEAGLAGVLTFYGVGPVVAPIVAFRVISYWLPAIAGALLGGYRFLQVHTARDHRIA